MSAAILYGKLKNWFNFHAMVSLIIAYVAALLFVLLPSRLVYGGERFLSDFLAWSFTFLVPNMYMFLLLNLHKHGQYKAVLSLIFGTVLLAITLAMAYLAFILNEPFRQFATGRLAIIFTSVSVLNFLLCYALAKPLAQDVSEKQEAKKFERAEGIRQDVSTTIGDELRHGDVE